MKKYRVEAFIIPTNVGAPIASNQIDDEKLAIIKSQEKSFSAEDEENEDESEVEVVADKEGEEEQQVEVEEGNAAESDDRENESSDLSGVFFDINEHIYDEIKVPEVVEERPAAKVEQSKSRTEYAKAFIKIEEPIYDEPFVGNLTTKTTTNADAKNVIGNNDASNYDVPQARWTLASSKYRRFGIVAPKLPKRSSSLQSIVEDIEIQNLDEDLCCHGRKNGCLPGSRRPEDISDEIFKENWMQRLDALRKLETLLKDKEVALQSRERLLFKKEKELRILERLVKDKMKQAELYAKRNRKALSAESVDNVKSDGSLASKTNSRGSLNSREEIFKTLPGNPSSESRSSLASLEHRQLGSIGSNVSSGRIGSMRSRSRPRQKIRYEDLDSTLSADIGDSSFVVTSKKFDPVVFKKPLAFSRSASERRPRHLQQTIAALPIKSLVERGDFTSESCVNVLEEKTLKKMSENVIASQNQESKFLNYGLIDGNATGAESGQEKKDLANQKRFSYLNLESINKSIKLKIKQKERPASWSEETDDWLKKKRQAYNMATKNLTTIESTNDKENFDRAKKTNKSCKITKKKESVQKRFSIFR